MCGFLTEFCFDNINITDTEAFSRLLKISKHRGPDDSQIQKGDFFQLGFNRLAILDLSPNGNQPMPSPEGRFSIVFNGEIYNYKELSKRYNLDNLISSSDTAVLVQLLDKIGIKETIKSLNGMFALSIIDIEQEALYLARDNAGIKPLFYGVSNKGLVSASQFNQISNHLWHKENLTLKPEAVKSFFGFGYMHAPETVFKNIYQVTPGELVSVTRDGSVKREVCVKIRTNTNEPNDSGLEVIKMEKLLSRAIKRQLRSDVPIASFLSGGIDSPLISAIIHKHNKDIKSFTMSVNDSTINESLAASNYAKHIDMKQIVSNMDSIELLEQLSDHFKTLGEPFGDYSSLPTFHITKAARNTGIVMLSGDGGDELFFGYPRMLDIIKKRHWYKVPFFIRRPIVRILIKLKIIRSWAPFQYKNLSDFVKAKHNYINKKNLELMFPEIEDSHIIEELYNFGNLDSKRTILNKLRQNEFSGHLQRILTKVDRMSMANSVEVRVPFLDKELLEEVFGWIPKKYSTNKDMKSKLKEMMLNYYPQSLITQDKKGFTVPLEEWLKSVLKLDVEKTIFDYPIYGHEYMNTDIIRNYVKDFFTNKHSNSWGIWHVYAWQKWAISQNLI